MVREMTWAPDAVDARLRVARFVRRSPLSARDVATAANAMAAQLEACFEAQLAVRVIPPVELADGDWERLREGRRCYNVCGEVRDAVMLIEEATARRIVAAAFGEEGSHDSLSRLESCVLERCMAQLAACLESLCGARRAPAEEACSVPTTYFELRLGVPADATLAIALGAPRHPAERTFLHAELLETCPIECSVRLGTGNVDIFTVAGLAVGDVVPLETKVGAFATLNLGLETVAAGEGGILGDRTAFKVHELI
ncbi:MAG: FliM/FliN family flagellar motor switch protein [Vulcanimicrobiaceae bacterium]